MTGDNSFLESPEMAGVGIYSGPPVPTGFAAFLAACYGGYAAAGILIALLGYLFDSFLWISLRHAILLGVVTINIVVSPNPFNASYHVGSCIVALIFNYWWSLDAIASTYAAVTVYGSHLSIAVIRLTILDEPTEKIDGDFIRTGLRMLFHLTTAAILFRRHEIYQHMFSNIWNCDPASLVAIKVFLLEFASELGNRRLTVGVTLESIYDSFHAIQAPLKRLDRFYFDSRPRLYHFLKLAHRQYTEKRDKQKINFGALPAFDYTTVPIEDDEIRVLYIPRRTWNPLAGGLIQGLLHAVPLEKATDYEYEALSYTWGDKNPRRPIRINGRRHDINQNLYELIQARRSYFHDRVLWVDALCIDQSNNEEKTKQILKMRDIYINARRVVAWLGDRFDARMAANTIVQISNNHNLWRARPDQFLNFWDRGSPQWRAFMKIIQHPYFTRAWVCQETGLGSDLQFYIGGVYIRPDNMWNAMMATMQPEIMSMICFENGLLGNNDLDGIKNWNLAFFLRDSDPKVRYDRDAVHPLGLILSWSARLQTTDPLDKVYAVLGISNSKVAKSIVPKYSISETELFHSTAVKLLESEEDAKYVLPHAGIRAPNDKPNLPSWAPDWERETAKKTELISVHVLPGMQKIQQMMDISVDFDAFSTLSGYKYEAGGKSKPTFRIDTTGKRLCTTAILVDTIQQTTCVYEHLNLNPAAHEAWFSETWSLTHGISDPAALPRTLIANRSLDTLDSRTDSQSLVRAYTTFRMAFPWFQLESLQFARFKSAVNPGGQAEVEAREATVVSAINFGARLKATCGGRKLCITTGNRLGVVPPVTEKGDVVCIIPGMQTPYTLRPSYGPPIGGPEREYALVGECFIDGMMDGEMMDEKAAIPIAIV